MNRSKFTSANNYQIDSFIEYYDIQTSEFPEIDELQGLLRKKDKSEIEITRQNVLKTKYANRMLSAEQLNYFCDCLINMENFISKEVITFVNGKQSEMTEFVGAKQLETTTFVNGKKLEIETTQGQVTNTINATRDGALQAIETKKQSIITYMDDTTAGAIRNDMGVKGELQTLDKNNLVNAINEVNKNKQSVTDNTLKTTDKTIVGAINENKESIRLSNVDINNRQFKIDSELLTTSKVVVGAINELNKNKQNMDDSSLNTSNKSIVGAINENKGKVDSLEKNVTSMNSSVANLNTNAQLQRDNGLRTLNKTIVGGINENFTNLALLNDKVTNVDDNNKTHMKTYTLSNLINWEITSKNGLKVYSKVVEIVPNGSVRIEYPVGMFTNAMTPQITQFCPDNQYDSYSANNKITVTNWGNTFCKIVNYDKDMKTQVFMQVIGI